MRREKRRGEKREEGEEVEGGKKGRGATEKKDDLSHTQILKSLLSNSLWTNTRYVNSNCTSGGICIHSPARRPASEIHDLRHARPHVCVF